MGILIVDSLQDQEDRRIACGIVKISQSIIVSCYFFTFLFSLIFRMFLIRLSDRGLVVRGRPNLALFHQLYWTVFGAFFCLGSTMFSVVPILRGSFEDSTQGRVCMLQPIENNEFIKTLVFQSVIPAVAICYNCYFCYKVRRYISKICPNGCMRKIGYYRRNMINFKENSRYIFFWAMFASWAMLVRLLPTIMPAISAQTLFWVSNGSTLGFIWFLHGLVLPASMDTPWKTKRQEASTFYVTGSPTANFPRHQTLRNPSIVALNHTPTPSQDPLPTSVKPYPFPPVASSPSLTESLSCVPASADDWLRTPSPIPDHPSKTSLYFLPQHNCGLPGVDIDT